LVQRGEHRLAVAGDQRARWRRSRSGLGAGLPRAIEAGARHAGRCAGRRDAQPGLEIGDGLHQSLPSLASGMPRSCETFFWTSISPSARSRRAWSRRVSRSSSAILRSRGSTGFGLGPRARGASPASSPRRRASRQADRCEEYSPSRRNNALNSPGFVHPSASRSTRSFSAAVNRRRAAFATTSDSTAIRGASRLVDIIVSRLALYIKLPGGWCLTHVGREGGVEFSGRASYLPHEIAMKEVAMKTVRSVLTRPC